MPEDGEIVYEDHSAEPHPAHFDQQVAQMQDLLPKSKAFIICALVPDENWTIEHQSCYTHVMIGITPGIRTEKFIHMAMQDTVEAINEFFAKEEENDGRHTPEG